MSIFFEESLWFEDFRLRPELGVVMDHVVRKPDGCAFLDLKSSEFSSRVDPVLDTKPVISGDWRVDTEVFLRLLIGNEINDKL